MEVVKFWQAQLINSDLDMYYEKTDTPALCRTSSLVEELGQIEYIFSDKTGTLTRNEMEFRMFTVGGIAYAEVVDESKREESSWRTFDEMRQIVTATGENREQKVIREFLSLLAVCHTVIPEIENGKVKYQASSPDEAALVAGSELLGYRFHVGTLRDNRAFSDRRYRPANPSRFSSK
jgi:phospholipid-transporting ATPase